jgi:hypothetical protein
MVSGSGAADERGESGGGPCGTWERGVPVDGNAGALVGSGVCAPVWVREAAASGEATIPYRAPGVAACESIARLLFEVVRCTCQSKPGSSTKGSWADAEGGYQPGQQCSEQVNRRAGVGLQDRSAWSISGVQFGRIPAFWQRNS